MIARAQNRAVSSLGIDAPAIPSRATASPRVARIHTSRISAAVSACTLVSLVHPGAASIAPSRILIIRRRTAPKASRCPAAAATAGHAFVPRCAPCVTAASAGHRISAHIKITFTRISLRLRRLIIPGVCPFLGARAVPAAGILRRIIDGVDQPRERVGQVLPCGGIILWLHHNTAVALQIIPLRTITPDSFLGRVPSGSCPR